MLTLPRRSIVAPPSTGERPSLACNRSSAHRSPSNCCSFMVFSRVGVHPSSGGGSRGSGAPGLSFRGLCRYQWPYGCPALKRTHFTFAFPVSQFSHAPASSARRFLCCFDEIMKIVSRFFILFPYFVRCTGMASDGLQIAPIVVITVLRDGLGALLAVSARPTAKDDCGAPDLHSRPCARDARIKPESIGRFPAGTLAPGLRQAQPDVTRADRVEHRLPRR